MTANQAIELITLFYVSPAGCYEDEIDQYQGARAFIESGCAELDEEERDIYRITDAGDEALYPYIKEIAEGVIGFMQEHGCECTDEEIQAWCAKQYDLKDEETIELIAFFICEKLQHFGCTASKYYSSEKGWFRRLEALEVTE